MISISAPTFDLDGSLLLRGSARSDLFSQSRRVSRTATLDGGVYLDDMGFTHGDRTLRITVKADSLKTIDALAYLHRTYAQLMVATIEGVFLGAISQISVTNGDIIITYLVKEKLTEV